jgi:hypothetical protein
MRVGLGVVGMSGLGPAQPARRTAILRPRSTILGFMEMLITRDGRCVNVFYFGEDHSESGIVNNFIKKIIPNTQIR